MKNTTKIYWDESNIIKQDISIIKFLDANSDLIRDKYNKFINNLSEREIDKSNLKNYFKLNDGYNLWWMSLIVERSMYKSNSHSNCLKLISLELIINQFSLKKISFVCNDIEVAKTVKALCKKLNVEINIISKFYYPSYKEITPNLLKVFLYGISYFIYRWPLIKIKKNNLKNFKNKLIIFSYLYRSKINKEKHRTVELTHLNDLQKIMHKKEIKSIWIHHFVSNFTKQNPKYTRNILDYTNLTSNLDYHKCFDTELSLNLIIKITKTYFYIYFKSFFKDNFINLFKLEDSELILWHVLKKDFDRSFAGIICFKNIVWIYQIDKILSTLPKQNMGIYLMENQGWERALIHAWNIHNHGKLAAYQYGVFRYWDLRYYDVPNSNNYYTSDCLPQPDIIAVGGQHALNLFKKMGHHDKFLFPVENLRYNNLPIATTQGLNKSGLENFSKKIIILFDIEIIINLRLINCINNLSEKFNNIEWSVKFHPANKFNVKKYLKCKFQIIEGDLKDYLFNIDLALAVSNSGSSVDMHLMGKPLIIFRDISTVNFSPFLKYSDEIKYVTNINEIEKAIEFKDNQTSMKEDFLWLNKNLTKWKKFLDTHI